jgi:hypothetical protein
MQAWGWDDGMAVWEGVCGTIYMLMYTAQRRVVKTLASSYYTYALSLVCS